MTFPHIVSEFNGVTGIAIGFGMPSERTDDAEFKPLCTIVIEVSTRNAEAVMERIRERQQAL